jgi:hypothetical protein
VAEKDAAESFVRDLKFSDINWEKMKKFFPVSKSEKDKADRKAQFSVIDMNGNGYASLAEIDRYFQVQGKDAEVIFRAKAPMLRAFNAAKDHYKSKSDIG